MAQILINPLFLDFPAYPIHKLEETLHDLPVNFTYNSNKWHHIFQHKHNFSNRCREDCIFSVALIVKAKVNVEKSNEEIKEPLVKDSAKCKHDCTIVVELKLVNKIWQIGDAWHDGPCFAGGSNGGGCLIN